MLNNLLINKVALLVILVIMEKDIDLKFYVRHVDPKKHTFLKKISQDIRKI